MPAACHWAELGWSILARKCVQLCDLMDCSPPGSSVHGDSPGKSGLPFPSPGDLPNLGIKSRSPALQAGSLLSEPPGKGYVNFFFLDWTTVSWTHPVWLILTIMWDFPRPSPRGTVFIASGSQDSSDGKEASSVCFTHTPTPSTQQENWGIREASRRNSEEVTQSVQRLQFMARIWCSGYLQCLWSLFWNSDRNNSLGILFVVHLFLKRVWSSLLSIYTEI